MIDGPDDDHGDGGQHRRDLPRPLLTSPLLLLLLGLLQRFQVFQRLHIDGGAKSTLQLVVRLSRNTVQVNSV